MLCVRKSQRSHCLEIVNECIDTIWCPSWKQQLGLVNMIFTYQIILEILCAPRITLLHYISPTSLSYRKCKVAEAVWLLQINCVLPQNGPLGSHTTVFILHTKFLPFQSRCWNWSSYLAKAAFPPVSEFWTGMESMSSGNNQYILPFPSQQS